MKSIEIENCVNSIKQEVLSKYKDSMQDEILETLNGYANEEGRIDNTQLALFAFTEALSTSIKLSTEITLKALKEILAED